MSFPSLDAALRYAGHGWPVFPCKPGAKLPAIPTAHPDRDDPARGTCAGECGRNGHGFHDATTDPAQIREWMARYPGANIAIATGAPGPDVLDVDTKGERSNGYADWNTVRRAGLTGTPQGIITTPSGGMHAYYRGTGQRSAALRHHGLDFRAAGGYVVAVPSVIDGKPYRLERSERSADTCDWQAIRRLLEPQQDRIWTPPAGWNGNVGHLAKWVMTLQEGNGNNGLFWASCRAAEAGDFAALDAIAAAGVEIGIPVREVAATVRSAQRTAGKAPHQSAGLEAAS